MVRRSESGLAAGHEVYASAHDENIFLVLFIRIRQVYLLRRFFCGLRHFYSVNLFFLVFNVDVFRLSKLGFLPASVHLVAVQLRGHTALQLQVLIVVIGSPSVFEHVGLL